MRDDAAVAQARAFDQALIEAIRLENRMVKYELSADRPADGRRVVCEERQRLMLARQRAVNRYERYLSEDVVAATAEAKRVLDMWEKEFA